MALWRREFTNTVYDCDILLCVGSLSDMYAYLRRAFPEFEFDREPDPENCNSIGKTFEIVGKRFTEWAIWLPCWEVGNRRHVQTLNHEALHLTIQILRHVGLRLSESSEEAFTYLHSAFFRDLWVALDDHAKQEKSRRTRKRSTRGARR